MLELSVIICAHNPRADYLRRVLDALRDQSLPTSQWELLLIDNGSKEPLGRAWDLSWHPNARHIAESQLGLAYARQRGIREASADLLVFVDDDNVLDQGYLAEVLKLSREWPQLGVWGSGNITPEFEIAFPEHLKMLLPWLAVRSATEAVWSNVFECKPAMPIGAGFCVRKSVGLGYCQLLNNSSIKISGRQGTLLLGGEDYEIAYAACSAGLGMGIFPELRLVHLIPKQRISEDYLLRLVEGSQVSEYLLGYKWRGKLPRDPITFLGLLDLVANTIVRRGLQRRKYFAERRAARKAIEIIKKASLK